MAEDKYLLAEEVLRQHFNVAHICIPKAADEPKSCSIPSVDAARGTPFEQCTVVIDDISLRINMFGMGEFKATGKHLLAFMLADMYRAFAHPNIHTYVMASDMSCFGTEAKEQVQQRRLAKAKEQAARHSVAPLAWDIDQPTPIIDINREVPRVLAIQCTPGAVRQALFEVMTLIEKTVRVPNGKRLILLMEPRQYTNPACLEDFMPADRSTGIVLCDDRMAEIDGARAELSAKAASLTAAQFRKAAREKTTELARAGCFYTTPICCETSLSGVSFVPFRLDKMKFQAGEADLTIQRLITYLYSGAIGPRLAGARLIAELDSSAYTAAQQDAMREVSRQAESEPFVGVDGPKTTQRAVVLSTDTDLCMLMVYTMAVLIAKEDVKRAADDPSGYLLHAPHAPLLIRGTVYTSSRAPVERGSTRVYCSEEADVPFAKLKSFEMLDPMLLYGELVRRGVDSDEATPLQRLIVDADRRASQANAKRKLTLEKKKLIAAGGAAPPEPKRSRTANGAAVVAHDDGDAVDVDAGLVVTLPALPLDATIDEQFERVASFLALTILMGNDYIDGQQGVPRRWAYIAFAEMLRNRSEPSLVQVLRLPGENDVAPNGERLAAPSLPLYVNYVAYERLLAYCYYMNLMAQACKTNKPSKPFDSLSFAEIEAAVVAKYKNKSTMHVPCERVRLRIAMRLLWVLRYITNGSSSARLLIDPLRFGWEEQWRRVIV